MIIRGSQPYWRTQEWGDSQANGAAEQAVQALGEQVRVIKVGLESRLGTCLRGSHLVTT